MATVKTPKQLARDAQSELNVEHVRYCRTDAFPKSAVNHEGDVARCRHGIVMMYVRRDAYHGPIVKTLTMKRNPILYRRALRALELEEAMRAEERDGGD